jgi:hypothetical protein
MIKIEMVPEVDTSSASGVSTREYIWLLGSPWPVPEGKDGSVNRIEAFGVELDSMEFPGGEVHDTDASGQKTSRVVPGLKSWKVKDARFISEKMASTYGRAT